MKNYRLLLTVAPLAMAFPALAQSATPSAGDTVAEKSDAQQKAAAKAADSDMVTTGVARGRDRLDSATSTSSLKEGEIQKYAPRSLAEIFRNIPGVRSESVGGEGGAGISIRGLPIALGGAKFLQLQEDGLPTLEFGDIAFGTADTFLRADLNLAQVEAIRGGSSSTFASNSPGGVINLISKTGDVEGGAVQASTGIDFEEYRIDFDYGAKINDTLRFHIGGFYREGEGPRHVGYNAYQGGQLKFNVTKDFASGYIRIYGKYLDDRTPSYQAAPALVTGSNSNPHYGTLPGFDFVEDSALSRYTTTNVTLDRNNNLVRSDMTDGQHSLVKSVGVESQFELGDWSVSERFRFANISGSSKSNYLIATGPAAAFTTALGGPGATLSYANGPSAGQRITNPAALNGNGLMAQTLLWDNDLKSLNNMTNDLRISRVWNVGEGKLTTTGGFYKAHQDIETNWQWSSVLMEVKGNGQAALLNVATAGGTPITQDGYFGYGTAVIRGARRYIYDLGYSVNAPYASVNYHIGRVAIGGSLRYDYGKASGEIFSSELGGGRVGTTSRDINGDGVISSAETRVSIYPLTQPGFVDYKYHYLSYSAGINFRIAEPMSVFARISRGARANADRILFGNLVNANTGKLNSKEAGYDPVKQLEGGVKFRKSGLTLNATAFFAKTKEHNIGIDRSYKAKGVEFEGGIRKGVFSFTAGATYTDAEITSDALAPAVVGNTPRHQAKIIFQATPQVETDRFTVGANIYGTTSSYAADTNQLKMPAYTVVNAFAQVRLTDRVLLSVNSNNLFNVKGIVEADAAIPATGIVNTRAINGRTISTAVRFNF